MNDPVFRHYDPLYHGEPIDLEWESRERHRLALRPHGEMGVSTSEPLNVIEGPFNARLRGRAKAAPHAR